MGYTIDTGEVTQEPLYEVEEVELLFSGADKRTPAFGGVTCQGEVATGLFMEHCALVTTYRQDKTVIGSVMGYDGSYGEYYLGTYDPHRVS